MLGFDEFCERMIDELKLDAHEHDPDLALDSLQTLELVVWVEELVGFDTLNEARTSLAPIDEPLPPLASFSEAYDHYRQLAQRFAEEDSGRIS